MLEFLFHFWEILYEHWITLFTRQTWFWAREAKWSLFTRQGKEAFAQQHYFEAIRFYTLALEEAEKNSSNARRMVISLNNLSRLYAVQQKHAEAEPLSKRALEITEKTYGPEHLHVAHALNNLAMLYYDQRDYAKAEPLYKRSLRIKESQLTPNDPDLAISLNNLAALYREKRNFSLAEPLFRRSLAIRQKALKPNHPDIANSLCNLGLLYFYQGDHAKAEPIYRRSLEINQRAYGSDHPSVSTSLEDYAQLLKAMDRTTEAQRLLDRAAIIRKNKKR